MTTLLRLHGALVLLGCGCAGVHPVEIDAPADAWRASDVTADAATLQDAAEPDALRLPDAPSVDVASPPDASPDARRMEYERDVRPVLEASACRTCHAPGATEYGPVLTYEWMEAAPTAACFTTGFAHRWNCFELHARTQTGVPTGQGCGSGFYHRHGEPCFTGAERATVLAWAAAGFVE